MTEPKVDARIKKLDERIAKVTQSTRTSFGLLIPIHNWLRLHFSWYYNWHLNELSSLVHIVILVVIVGIIGVISVISLGGVFVLGLLYLSR